MKIKETKKAFLKHLGLSEKELGKLDLTKAVDLVLDFYGKQRVERCDSEGDGDMLLVQWGTEYGAKPDEFYFDLTRQFIEEAASEEEEVDEDSRIFQLSLTFHYKGAAKLEDSNKWCHSPAKAEEFRAFVLSCPGLVATRNAQMKKAVLRLECAG